LLKSNKVVVLSVLEVMHYILWRKQTYVSMGVHRVGAKRAFPPPWKLEIRTKNF